MLPIRSTPDAKLSSRMPSDFDELETVDWASRVTSKRSRLAR